MQGNHVGDAGAVALADGLVGGNKRGGRRRGGAAKQGSSRRGPGLRSLNLAGNGIGCAGGGALAKALVSGKGGGGGEGGVVLEELELAGNAVSCFFSSRRPRLTWHETCCCFLHCFRERCSISNAQECGGKHVTSSRFCSSPELDERF